MNRDQITRPTRQLFRACLIIDVTMKPTF